MVRKIFLITGFSVAIALNLVALGAEFSSRREMAEVRSAPSALAETSEVSS